VQDVVHFLETSPRGDKVLRKWRKEVKRMSRKTKRANAGARFAFPVVVRSFPPVYVQDVKTLKVELPLLTSWDPVRPFFAFQLFPKLSESDRDDVMMDCVKSENQYGSQHALALLRTMNHHDWFRFTQDDSDGEKEDQANIDTTATASATDLTNEMEELTDFEMVSHVMERLAGMDSEELKNILLLASTSIDLDDDEVGELCQMLHVKYDRLCTEAREAMILVLSMRLGQGHQASSLIDHSIDSLDEWAASYLVSVGRVTAHNKNVKLANKVLEHVTLPRPLPILFCWHMLSLGKETQNEKLALQVLEKSTEVRSFGDVFSVSQSYYAQLSSWRTLSGFDDLIIEALKVHTSPRLPGASVPFLQRLVAIVSNSHKQYTPSANVWRTFIEKAGELARVDASCHALVRHGFQQLREEDPWFVPTDIHLRFGLQSAKALSDWRLALMLVSRHIDDVELSSFGKERKDRFNLEAILVAIVVCSLDTKTLVLLTRNLRKVHHLLSAQAWQQCSSALLSGFANVGHIEHATTALFDLIELSKDPLRYGYVRFWELKNANVLCSDTETSKIVRAYMRAGDVNKARTFLEKNVNSEEVTVGDESHREYLIGL